MKGNFYISKDECEQLKLLKGNEDNPLLIFIYNEPIFGMGDKDDKKYEVSYVVTKLDNPNEPLMPPEPLKPQKTKWKLLRRLAWTWIRHR